MTTILEELIRYRTLLETSGIVNFEGVLCALNKPSDKSPNGAKAHPVMLPSEVAKKALHTLIGAPLNCTADFSNHADGWKSDAKVVGRTTIGLITNAFIDEDKLRVFGYLTSDKNRDVIDQIIKMPENSLGMSYEMQQASVENINAYTWILSKANFTGAAIILKKRAAYSDSSFHLI